MTIHFHKYQGTGNDFVIMDNRDEAYNQLSTEQVAALCHRRFGIGADGLMLLNTHPHYDFQMIYFNSDGRESSMCGNGGRCLTRFAWDLQLRKEVYRFLAIDGPHDSKVEGDGRVWLKMKDVDTVEGIEADYILNTGSPHFIRLQDRVEELDVFTEGRSVRYSPRFAAEGINVNFVERLAPGSIRVRTYERGVEGETLSCGTGVTAAALVCGPAADGTHKVQVETPGGNLQIAYTRNGNSFTEIWLIGPAEPVFQGTIYL